MSTPSQPRPQRREPDFATVAGERPPGFLNEFWHFLRSNKKWWLTPIILTLMLVSILVVIAGAGGGPLIYTLF